MKGGGTEARGPKARSTGRRALRRLRLRAHRWAGRLLMRLAALLAPRLYGAYMRLVFATSVVRENGIRQLSEFNRFYDGIVCLLWHEEVFGVAYAFPHVGLNPHTLVGHGQLGDVMTAVLEQRGYVVLRGGSQRRSRRRNTALLSLIRTMKRSRQVLYGFTVDGSKGPAYVMKPGGIAVARACERPVFLVRTCYRRALRLRTWDRTLIPLPFNEIAYHFRGPYTIDKSASAEEFEQFRLLMEKELSALSVFGHARFLDDLPAASVVPVPAAPDPGPADRAAG